MGLFQANTAELARQGMTDFRDTIFEQRNQDRADRQQDRADQIFQAEQAELDRQFQHQQQQAEVEEKGKEATRLGRLCEVLPPGPEKAKACRAAGVSNGLFEDEGKADQAFAQNPDKATKIVEDTVKAMNKCAVDGSKRGATLDECIEEIHAVIDLQREALRREQLFTDAEADERLARSPEGRRLAALQAQREREIEIQKQRELDRAETDQKERELGLKIPKRTARQKAAGTARGKGPDEGSAPPQPTSTDRADARDQAARHAFGEDSRADLGDDGKALLDTAEQAAEPAARFGKSTHRKAVIDESLKLTGSRFRINDDFLDREGLDGFHDKNDKLHPESEREILTQVRAHIQRAASLWAESGGEFGLRPGSPEFAAELGRAMEEVGLRSDDPVIEDIKAEVERAKRVASPRRRRRQR